MSADNNAQGNETCNAFRKNQECKEFQQECAVKHHYEKHNSTSHGYECKGLRRSYRLRVKPRRFESEEIELVIRSKSNSSNRSEIISECFRSESEHDCDAFVKEDTPEMKRQAYHQHKYINSKNKKRDTKKYRSSEKLQNGRENTCNLENKYTKSELKSPYLKNETKSKSFEQSELRRSNRSPVKPRRFESDIIKSTQKTNKRRVGDKVKRDWNSLTKEKHQLLTPIKNYSISPKTPSAKKSLNRWKIVYPTSEEISEIKRRENAQIRSNRKVKAILKDLIQVPKKVKILSLNSMTAEEILDSFPKYKDQLDVIFRKLSLEPKVTGYNGINHYSVIELIDNENQLKMMHKLGEIYETDHDGVSMYPMLFANALMPEWLVYIFKDKYNLSYTEAVTHLDKQRQYMQYMAVDDHFY